MSIDVVHDGMISRIVFNTPPMNLMTIEILDSLVAAHQEADARKDTRVIVTQSALPGMFSNGLDPQYVLAKSPQERTPIFRAVGRLLHHLVHLRKPHICAINGPAMAGGAILAITADFRLFDQEHGRLSFSEPKVGLPIPRAVIAVIRRFCAAPYLRDVIMLGKNMDAADALKFGLADGAANGADLAALTDKLAERLARISPTVMQEIKRGLIDGLAPLTEAMTEREPSFDHFVGDDFLGEGLSALVEQRFAKFTR